MSPLLPAPRLAPRSHLSHLESRMRQSGDWIGPARLTRPDLLDRLRAAIGKLNVDHVRQETGRYLRDKSSLELWSREFFVDLAERIEVV